MKSSNVLIYSRKMRSFWQFETIFESIAHARVKKIDEKMAILQA